MMMRHRIGFRSFRYDTDHPDHDVHPIADPTGVMEVVDRRRRDLHPVRVDVLRIVGVFFASSLRLARRRLSPRSGRTLWLGALPLVASAFDYLEDAYAWWASTSHPEPIAVQAVRSRQSRATAEATVASDLGDDREAMSSTSWRSSTGRALGDTLGTRSVGGSGTDDRVGNARGSGSVASCAVGG